MGFVRVRSTTGPDAVYEVSEEAFNARPGAYVLADAGSEDKPVEGETVVKSARKGARK